MEELLKKAPLQSIRDFAKQSAIFGNIEYTLPNGSLMSDKQWRWAMKRDEAFWDDMTAQVAKYERAHLVAGETIPEWLKKAEIAAYHRETILKCR